MNKEKKSITWKEFKNKDLEYKIGYIIGSILMFAFGLVSCLLVYLVPLSRIPLLIISITLFTTIKIKKRNKNNE